MLLEIILLALAVFCRRLESGADELVYREQDPGYFVGVQKSESRRFIFVVANDHTTTEWRYMRTDSDSHALTLVAEREPGVDYSVVDFDDRFWIRTNRNGAVDFALRAYFASHALYRAACARPPALDLAQRTAGDVAPPPAPPPLAAAVHVAADTPRESA